MARTIPNLARRPFRNRRPAIRLGVGLWLLAAGALASATWLYLDYWRGAANSRAEIARLEAAIADERQRIGEREQQLGALALEAGNEQTRVLNEWIADRVFSWGGLLDDLEEVLPIGARVQSLAPERRREVNRGARKEAERVGLRLEGTVENEDALVELLENLYAHPRFGRPVLSTERREELRQTSFNLTVEYLPASAAGNPEAVEAADTAVTDELAASGAPGEATVAGLPKPNAAGAGAGGAVPMAPATPGRSPVGVGAAGAAPTAGHGRGDVRAAAAPSSAAAAGSAVAPTATPGTAPLGGNVIGMPSAPVAAPVPAAPAVTGAAARPGGATPGPGLGSNPGSAPLGLPPVASGTVRLVPRGSSTGGRGGGR